MCSIGFASNLEVRSCSGASSGETQQQSRKKYRCFNAQSRYLLECYLTGRMGIPKTTMRKQLAVIFECDVKTIYNEIKSGTVDHLTSELETVYVYSTGSMHRAEYAQHKASFENTAAY